MLGISAVPAIIQMLCMFSIPESPKWLIKMEREQEAEEVFCKIFKADTPEGREEIDQEINRIKESLELEDVKASQYLKYKELLTVYRRIAIIGIGLQVWQQLSGINTIMYYGPDVMEDAGLGDSTDLTAVFIYKIFFLKISEL